MISIKKNTIAFKISFIRFRWKITVPRMITIRRRRQFPAYET